jgi:hypothetical protein
MLRISLMGQWKFQMYPLNPLTAEPKIIRARFKSHNAMQGSTQSHRVNLQAQFGMHCILGTN